METLPKTLHSKVRVQYQDCDPFNHLNNSKYIDYMVGARTEQLLDYYNFNTSQIARENRIGWVAANTQISYLKPAQWMEMLTIETRLIRVSNHSLLVEALMWNEHRSQLKSVMWTKLVHFNIAEQKSHHHTPELMNFFGKILSPTSESSFEDRVKHFKQSIAVV
jgi:acyl-CoA thioester hydrolase